LQVLARIGNRSSILYWDVINEPICDDVLPIAAFLPVLGEGELDLNLPSNCELGDSNVKPSAWVSAVPGDGAPPEYYIDTLFNLTRSLLPPGRGKLVLNDYLAESDLAFEDPFKAQRLIDAVNKSLHRGVPIDAIGLQFHVNMWHSGKGLIGNLLFHGWRRGVSRVFKWIEELGLEVHVTELDVGCNWPTLPCPPYLAIVQRVLQAAVYADVARECLKSPACTVLSTWGFTDRYSWRSGPPPGNTLFNQRAHLLDGMYVPKPAAFAYSQALREGRPAPG
jgi:endo-1,4-beta-xylanase